jgi:hypothetical protein
LLATDALGMRAEGAFWLYDSRRRDWDFFLITSLFNALGAREIYLLLNGALAKKLSERETGKFQLFIGAPTESLAKMVRALVTTNRFASEPRQIAVSLPNEETLAVVYRMAEPSNDQDVRRTKMRFRRLSKEVMAA